jgi:hypothetical protein
LRTIKAVIDEAAVRKMTKAERAELIALLASLEMPAPDEPGPGQRPTDPYLSNPALRRNRRLALVISAGCCVALAVWIVVLAATLPRHFNAHYWRALWVNFAVLLFAAFAATAWATWRKRQILILLLMLTGTMLLCDAWFDVGTSLGSSSMWLSIASALLAELPLAFLAFAGARRLLKATVEAGLEATWRQPTRDRMAADGANRGCSPSLRRTPLSGAGLRGALPPSLADEAAGPSRQTAS